MYFNFVFLFSDPTQDIVIGIAAGIIFILFLAGSIISFVFEYKKKQSKHKEELLLEKIRNEKLVLQTQFEVQEQTRKNIASDLHDNIGQLLSLTNLTLASINLLDIEKAEQKINDTRSLITRSIKELRQLSKIIHGEQLIQQGLIETIEQEINWLKRNEQYIVRFEHEVSTLETNQVDKDLFLYRLLQECLNNIIKHSGATQIYIQLLYRVQIMHLTIQDNGVGFNYTEVSKLSSGLGLANMQKRIDLLKGTFHIHSEPNKGTTLEFSIPYEISEI